MPRIAVFDSGLGSLSIIKPIQNKLKSEIIYYADQKNFPYGTKSVSRLEKIIKTTIDTLQKKFEPDLIIIGSNTPSLLLKKFTNRNIIGVYPPIKQAVRNSRSHAIAVLATKSVIESKALKDFIKKNVPKRFLVKPINASPLVNLVESGKFIQNKKLCKQKIKEILLKPITTDKIDVVTLSSTHLPFLLPILYNVFPKIIFMDPANLVAEQVEKKLKTKISTRNSMKVFTSGNAKHFQYKLSMIGIKNKVENL